MKESDKQSSVSLGGSERIRVSRGTRNKIILCAVFLALCALCLAFGLVAIFLDNQRIIPKGVVAVTFFAGGIGVILCFCLLVKFILRGRTEVKITEREPLDEPPRKVGVPQSVFSVKEAVILITARTIAGVGLILIGAAVNTIPSGGKTILIIFGAVLFASSVLQTVIKYALYRRNKNFNAALTAAFARQTNKNPQEDVIRIPVGYDDEEGKEEQERQIKEFLESVVLPKGFADYLNAADDRKVFILASNDFACNTYYEAEDKFPADKLKEINLDMLAYRDDYYTQFRKILLFAGDESGHCYFLLDYGKVGEPSVKLLDDEADEVCLLANSFKEFKDKLLTPKEAKAILGKNYYGYSED